MAATVVLAACGGDDKKSSSEGDKPTTLRITASQPASGQYRIDVPASVKVGGIVKIEFHNADKVIREAQLIRIDGAHTIDEVLAKREVPRPDWLHVAGGVGSTKPGQTSTTFQELPAGRYVVVDTNSGEGSDAPDYYTKGALAPLQVTGGGKAGHLPPGEGVITIKERAPGFLSTTLKPGSHMVLIDNISSEPYDVAVEPILPGKTLEDIRKYLRSGSSGPSPFDDAHTMFTPQIEGSDPDQVTRQVVQLDLQPGRYALTSYLTTRADGPSPAAKGFVIEVDVAEPTAAGGPSLSKEEYVRTVTSITLQFQREEQEAGRETATTLPAIEARTKRILAVVTGTTAKLLDVKPPADVKDLHQQLIDALRSYARTFTPVIEAAAARDAQRFEIRNKELSAGYKRYVEQLRALIREYRSRGYNFA